MVHVIFSIQQYLRDGDDAVAVLLEKLQNGWQRFRSVQCGIVEQADGAGLDLAGDAFCDLRRGEVFPVQTVSVPYSCK